MRESQELNHYPAEPHFETARGGGLTKLIAALCASALVVALLAGFLFLRKRQTDQLDASRRAGQTARAAAPIRAQVFQDEVRLRGSEALVGGTVKNISAAPLEGLSIEIELKGRGSRASEAKLVQLSPASLRPGEEGKYSLRISPTEWAGAQVVHLRGEPGGADIPFKPEIGLRRPPENPPAPKVVVEQRPRRKGDDFLNTPDTPIRIP
jgi:uncharacterized iron-regulated membrane protein